MDYKITQSEVDALRSKHFRYRVESDRYCEGCKEGWPCTVARLAMYWEVAEGNKAPSKSEDLYFIVSQYSLCDYGSDAGYTKYRLIEELKSIPADSEKLVVIKGHFVPLRLVLLDPTGA